MKKLLFLSLFLLSCEKDTRCWDCEVTTTYTSTHFMTETVISKERVCDMTEAEIRAYETDKYSFITIKIGSTTATTNIVYKCK